MVDAPRKCIDHVGGEIVVAGGLASRSMVIKTGSPAEATPAMNR